MHVAWRSALWQTFKSLTTIWHAQCSQRSRGQICLLPVIPPKSSCQLPCSLSCCTVSNTTLWVHKMLLIHLNYSCLFSFTAAELFFQC